MSERLARLFMSRCTNFRDFFVMFKRKTNFTSLLMGNFKFTRHIFESKTPRIRPQYVFGQSNHIKRDRPYNSVDILIYYCMLCIRKLSIGKMNAWHCFCIDKVQTIFCSRFYKIKSLKSFYVEENDFSISLQFSLQSNLKYYSKLYIILIPFS